MILIEMDKPKICDRCRFSSYEEWYCYAAERTIYKVDRPLPKWCPLIEVKETYGEDASNIHDSQA
jgi:hypothetical protein